MTHADDYNSKKYSYEQKQRNDETRDIKLDRVLIKKLNNPMFCKPNTTTKVIKNLYQLLLKDK